MTTRSKPTAQLMSEYSQKRDVKRVSFNKEKAEDIERLRKIEQIPILVIGLNLKLMNYPPSAGFAIKITRDCPKRQLMCFIINQHWLG